LATEGVLLWSLSNKDLENRCSQYHFEAKLIDSENSSLAFMTRKFYEHHGLELFRGSVENVKIIDSQVDVVDLEFLNNTESLVRSPVFCPKGKRAYFEVTFQHVGSNPKIGFCSEDCKISLGQFFDLSDVMGDCWATSAKTVYFEHSSETPIESSAEWQKGSVVGIMCDLLHGTIVTFHNGTFQHLFLTESLKNVQRLHPVLICESSHMLVNFGQKPFSHTHFSFLPIFAYMDFFLNQSLHTKSDSLLMFNRWDKIDVQDKDGIWWKAVVLKRDETSGILVHYIGYERDYDETILHAEIPFRIRSRRNCTKRGDKESLRKVKLLYGENSDNDLKSDGMKLDDFVADWYDYENDDDVNMFPHLFPLLNRIFHDNTVVIEEYKRPKIVKCDEEHICAAETYEDSYILCQKCGEVIQGHGSRCYECDFDICVDCATLRSTPFCGLVQNSDDGKQYRCRLTVFDNDWHCCDLCREHIPQGSQGLQCSECDFDVCHVCTSMPDEVRFEKISTIRSEKPYTREGNPMGFFEIQILNTTGFLQLGLITNKSRSDTTKGVGCDENEWGCDVLRGTFWSCGESEDLSNFECHEGDVLGFMCDFSCNVVSLFLNGKLEHSKVMLASDVCTLYPAVTGSYSSIRVYWRNGFMFGVPREILFPNCIMCDKHHVCRPCVFDDESVCSVCQSSIALQTYGIQCQSCRFFVCSKCDLKSSVYLMNNEKESQKVCNLSSRTDKSFSNSLQAILNAIAEWKNLALEKQISQVNDWIKMYHFIVRYVKKTIENFSISKIRHLTIAINANVNFPLQMQI
jgi:hypothetical protein